MATGSAIGAEARKAPVERPTAAEALAQVRAPDGAANDKTGAGGVPEHHTFTLDYKDKRGRVWTGEFKCHALSIREKIDVGLLKTRMGGSVPGELMDVTTSNLLEMIAHLTIALDHKVSPAWAQPAKLEEIKDAGVLIALYTEVNDHEARFHGTGAEESGAADGAPDAGRP